MYISMANEVVDYFSNLIKKSEKSMKAKSRVVNPPPQLLHDLKMMKNCTEYCATLSKIIRDSVKFKLSSDLLIDATNSPIDEIEKYVGKDVPLSLPYDSICIESEIVDLKGRVIPILTLASQDEENIFVIHVTKGTDGEWHFDYNYELMDSVFYVIHRQTMQCQAVRGNRHNEVQQQEENHFWVNGPLRILANLLSVLSCTNTVIQDSEEKPSRSENKKRREKNKLPFFEFKVLGIKAEKVVGASKGHGGSGSHQSPRSHLRRGHIRRLKTKNVWVNSCVVGDPNKGSIDKEYII